MTRNKNNVTVKTKNSAPIIIEVPTIRDISVAEEYLYVFKEYNTYCFKKSEIEYYFIERIVYDENEEERN